MILVLFAHLLTIHDKPYWSNFCERHLVAEDPYQYEHLTVDQLIDLQIQHHNEKSKSKALTNEIIKRLQYEPLTEEQYERLSKVLEFK